MPHSNGSDPDPEGQLTAVRAVLSEIEATNLPEIVVINKCDAADPFAIDRIKLREKNAVAVSALTGQGIDELIAMIEDQLPSPQIDVKVLIPYTQGDLLARIYKEGHLLSRTDTENGYLIVAKVPENLAIQLDQLS